MLSHALFTFYTADCRNNSDANLLIKFADDTSLTGLAVQDEAAYKGDFQELVEWCDSNCLKLNVSETQELVVDFRAAPTDTEPITIKGQSVEMVSAYRYLGTVIDNKLSWTPKLTQQRTKNVPPAGVASLQSKPGNYEAVHYHAVCFFSNAKKGDTGRLDKINRTAEQIMRADPLSPSDIFQQAALRKLSGIQADTSHPLHAVVQSCAPARDSSRRLRSLKYQTTRRLNSFIPVAIRLHNAAL